jgi:hypothetical protein
MDELVESFRKGLGSSRHRNLSHWRSVCLAEEMTVLQEHIAVLGVPYSPLSDFGVDASGKWN